MRRETTPQPDALDKLLLGAGTASVHWASALHRAQGGREATKIYLPDPCEIGMGRFKIALALRYALGCMFYLQCDESRQLVAAAMRALIVAARVEPPMPYARKAADPVRPYWVDRE